MIFQVFPPLLRRVDQTVYIRDEKAANQDGGFFESGAWRTRTLNTLENPLNAGWVSLSSNQFTLDAGTYLIEGSAPAMGVNSHKARIRNITDGIDEIMGTSEYADRSDGATDALVIVTKSCVEGYIQITSQKTFELQHQGETDNLGNGFGIAVTFGVTEVYSRLKIKKIG